MLPQLIITVHRVLVSDPVVQVSLDIVIRLVLRVRVGNINFITVSIPVPTPGVCSVDVVHVALLQVFAAVTGAVFFQKMAVLPTHVHNPDQSEDHRDGGKTQESMECIGFRV